MEGKAADRAAQTGSNYSADRLILMGARSWLPAAQPATTTRAVAIPATFKKRREVMEVIVRISACILALSLYPKGIVAGHEHRPRRRHSFWAHRTMLKDQAAISHQRQREVHTPAASGT